MDIGTRLLRAARRLHDATPRPEAEPAVPGRFDTRRPAPQNAIDLFAGNWSSRFPEPLAGLSAGSTPLFEDPRIRWFLERIGGARGRRVLELGPLEGGHAWMMEQAGAETVVSVESNTGAYLRCLVTKELLGMQRTRFLLGDATAYLEDGDDRVDIVLACGILYHLVDPVRFIERLCARCERDLFVWTHYYDAGIIAANPAWARKFERPHLGDHGGWRYTACRYRYLDALAWRGFSGGSAAHSQWLTRDVLLEAFARFGCPVVELAFDDRAHVNGPALAFRARRA